MRKYDKNFERLQFRTMISDNTELSDEKINELANAFMDALPTMMKIRLQAA